MLTVLGGVQGVVCVSEVGLELAGSVNRYKLCGPSRQRAAISTQCGLGGFSDEEADLAGINGQWFETPPRSLCSLRGWCVNIGRQVRSETAPQGRVRLRIPLSGP